MKLFKLFFFRRKLFSKNFDQDGFDQTGSREFFVPRLATFGFFFVALGALAGSLLGH